jgi:hypothetical protein
MVLAAAREALRWLGYGRGGEETADAVVEHVRAGEEAPRRRWLGGALWRRMNRARIDTMARASRAPTMVASELLDKNTCGPCRRVDGTVFPTQEAAILAYGGGGYLFCEGLDRCRGLCIGLWSQE